MINKLPDAVVSMLYWGMGLSAAGFAVGYFGSLIFTRKSEPGKILSLFVTGPLGLILGLIFGLVKSLAGW